MDILLNQLKIAEEYLKLAVAHHSRQRQVVEGLGRDDPEYVYARELLAEYKKSVDRNARNVDRLKSIVGQSQRTVRS